MKNIFISSTLLILLFVSCGVRKETVNPLTDVERARAEKNNPEAAMSDLIAGKLIYAENCQTCHPLKDPTFKTEDGWAKIVPVMVSKVNQITVKISASQEKQLLLYLQTMSKP